MAEYIERSAAVKAVLRERSPANSVAQNRKLSIIQRDLLTIPAADVAPLTLRRWCMGSGMILGGIHFRAAGLLLGAPSAVVH